MESEQSAKKHILNITSDLLKLDIHVYTESFCAVKINKNLNLVAVNKHIIHVCFDATVKFFSRFKISLSVKNIGLNNLLPFILLQKVKMCQHKVAL